MFDFENILQFQHFSIALDMSRITHFVAEIMNPKNSASGNFLIFLMSAKQLVLMSPTIYFICAWEFIFFNLHVGTFVNIIWGLSKNT